MAGTQYLDLGAIQKKDGGSGTKGAQYLDLGALQKQEAAAVGGATIAALAHHHRMMLSA